jgi:hypothetical protein
LAGPWIRRGGKTPIFVRTLTADEYRYFKLTGELPSLRSLPDDQPETEEKETQDND